MSRNTGLFFHFHSCVYSRPCFAPFHSPAPRRATSLVVFPLLFLKANIMREMDFLNIIRPLKQSHCFFFQSASSNRYPFNRWSTAARQLLLVVFRVMSLTLAKVMAAAAMFPATPSCPLNPLPLANPPPNYQAQTLVVFYYSLSQVTRLSRIPGPTHRNFFLFFFLFSLHYHLILLFCLGLLDTISQVF